MKWRKWLAGSVKVSVEKLECGHSAGTEWKRLHAVKTVSRAAQKHIQKMLHFLSNAERAAVAVEDYLNLNHGT